MNTPETSGSATADNIAGAIAGIDCWLETMRSQQGYSGPVAHSWEDCLIYTGPGFDWRYEGIISGYLNLYQASGEARWLEKAIRAGNDLLLAQLPDGRFRASSFEVNPAAGGTPHEAACDLGLLRLAAALKAAGGSWEVYHEAARRNLVDYHIQCLWDARARSFWNSPGDCAIVPNKISTLCEAAFALADLEASDALLEQFFLPALQSILPAKVGPGDDARLYGAIDQSIGDHHPSGRYFPYYAARCVPALAAAYRHTGEQVYLDTAAGAMDFVFRCRLPDGSFPQALFHRGQQMPAPRWVAACGDILLSALELKAHGYTPPDLQPTESWLLAGILPSGGIRTAAGFTSVDSLRPSHGLPEFRDLLPVCGWVDKAFRYLTVRAAGIEIPAQAACPEVEMECVFYGRRMLYHETAEVIEAREKTRVVYRWQKGANWAEIFTR